ncbi:MAG TPA: DUF4157 domain-containing protein [Longimicrobium sp.]|nr:DUF4157 domain-containing protein [Longimicrobium sp.]
MSAPPRSGGRLLPHFLRQGMESLLGHDLSGVRVHEDASAPAIGAVAYTRGDRIHFAPGAYRPATAAGRRLLGHELTHVAQQREGKVASTARIGGLPLNDSPALEREADRTGERLGRGSAPAPGAPIPDAGGAPKAALGGDATPVQRAIEDDPELLQYSRENENVARDIVPRAGNQLGDLRADRDALARHELTRHMNKTVLRGDPGADGLKNTLKTAMSACRYHGGMCNEYSALSFATHMASPLVSGMPIVRYWNPDMKHSFTSFGDDRSRDLPRTIADPWTMEQDPVLMRDTVMHGGRNHVVADWSDRMAGEGRVHVRDWKDYAKARFDAAEREPAFRDQRRLLFDVNRQEQRDQLRDIRQGAPPSDLGIWNHRTNRR